MFYKFDIESFERNWMARKLSYKYDFEKAQKSLSQAKCPICLRRWGLWSMNCINRLYLKSDDILSCFHCFIIKISLIFFTHLGTNDGSIKTFLLSSWANLNFWIRAKIFKKFSTRKKSPPFDPGPTNINITFKSRDDKIDARWSRGEYISRDILRLCADLEESRQTDAPY